MTTEPGAKPARRLSRIRSAVSIKSVLIRLAVSYAALVFIVSMAVATAAYLFFQTKYNEQLEWQRTIDVRRAERELRNDIVDVSKTVYMECAAQLGRDSWDFFAPEDLSRGNTGKLLLTYEYLNDLVGRYPDTIEAVHLYYPGSDLIVSSIDGLRYQGGDTGRTTGKDWLRELADASARSVWLSAPLRNIPDYRLGGGVIELRIFPLLADAASCTVVIAVEFRADNLHERMARLASDYSGSARLLAADGRVLAEFDTNGLQSGVPLPAETLAADAVFYSRIHGSGDASSLVTSIPVGDTPWKLVDVTPLARLYRRGDSIRLILILICISGIVLGLTVAFFLTRRIYNPLDRLMIRVRALFGIGIPPPSVPVDEYVELNYAIDGLASRMSRIDAVLLTNRPIIQHEVVNRLLEGDFQNLGDLRDAFALLEPRAFPEVCAVALFSVAPDGDGAPARVAKYRLAEGLEKQGERMLLCSALAGPNVAAVFDAGEMDGEEIEPLARSWVDLADRDFGIHAFVAVGSIVESPLLLNASCEDAHAAISCRFIFPERRVFVRNAELAERETVSLELPRGLIDSFAEALRLKDRSTATELLASTESAILAGTASATSCRYALKRLASVVAGYAESLRAEKTGETSQRLERMVEEASDASSAIRLLAGEMDTLFSFAFERSEDRGGLLAERVKRYVADNFRGDLSLDTAAEAVGISSAYLSKLFKERSGKNFVSYVTDIRLTEAELLIRTTNESVQEVAKRSGFNTPAYFIHQFKARFGVTPVDYRRSMPENSGT